MRKLAGSLLVVACVLLNFFPTSTGAQDTIRVGDSTGNLVELPHPVERIACLAPGVTEVICALGEEDSLVGVDDFSKRNTEVYPFLEDVEGIGLSMLSPFDYIDYEKIIDLDPDVVICLAEPLCFYPELEDKMEEEDIPVMRLNCSADTFEMDVKALGMMLDEEELAQKYIDFATSYAEEITERIEEMDLDPEDKTRVYFEFRINDVTCGDSSVEGQLLQMAGGENIFPEYIFAEEEEEVGEEILIPPALTDREYVSYYWVNPDIMPEEIVDRNPEVIVKHYMDPGDIGKARDPKIYGYTSKPNLGNMGKARCELMKRPGWEDIDAIADERVYIFAFGELIQTPRWPIALGYLAKWFYPDEFSDLDPREFHEEWLSRWHDVEYKGLYVYTDPEE
jgi:iron complex transport system substrate-binding protein